MKLTSTNGKEEGGGNLLLIELPLMSAEGCTSEVQHVSHTQLDSEGEIERVNNPHASLMFDKSPWQLSAGNRVIG